MLAAAWKFLREGGPPTREEALDALYALGRRIRISSKLSELDEIEREIDRILQGPRANEAAGEKESREAVALNVAAHRLENLVHDRRLALAAQQDSTSQGRAAN